MAADPRRRHRRRGGAVAGRGPRCPTPGRRGQHASTCTGWRWPSPAGRRRGRLHRVAARRPAVGRGPGRTSAGSRCSGCTRTGSSCSRSWSPVVLADAGGVVYLLLVGGANPHVATSDLTLSLLVMVVLGGAGRPLGRDARRGRCTRCWTTGWRAGRLRRRRRPAAVCCASRCPSRCSCSACCSCWWCCSCPVGSPRWSGRAAGRCARGSGCRPGSGPTHECAPAPRRLAGARCPARAGRVAVQDGASRLSYAELEERSARLAERLRAAGLGRGDRSPP